MAVKPGDKILATDMNKGLSAYNTINTLKVGRGLKSLILPGGGLFLDAIPSNGLAVKYGKVATLWSAGSLSISLTPCAKDGTVGTPTPANVDVYLQGESENATPPTNESLPVQLDAQVGAVLMYLVIDTYNYLLNPPVPTVQATGGAQYMVYQLGGAQGPAMFDYPRAAP
jgi:hypothetical protein